MFEEYREALFPSDLAYLVLNNLDKFNDKPVLIKDIVDRLKKLTDSTFYTFYDFYDKAYNEYYSKHDKFPDMAWIMSALPNKNIKIFEGTAFSMHIYDDFIDLLKQENIKQYLQRNILDKQQFTADDLIKFSDLSTSYLNSKQLITTDAKISLDDKLNYPIEALPEDFRNFALNVSEVMDAPIEFIASGLIAGASILLNKKAKVAIKNDWIEPAVLWTMIIAKPGLQLKTPCFKVTKSIIDNLDKQLNQKYKVDKLCFEKQKEFSKKNEANKEDRESIQEPTRELIYTADTTVESLIQIQSTNSQGVAIINDEISHFLRSLNQYKKGGGNDKQYFLTAFSGGRHITTRIRNKEPLTVVPYHNIFGTIQPSEVEKLMFNDNISTDGFKERWLYILSDHERTGKIIRKDINIDLKMQVESVFKDIFENTEEYIYRLSEKSEQIFDNYAFSIFQMQNQDGTPDILKSYLEKQKTYTARLALILHCINNINDPVISTETMNNAVKLSEYYITCFKKLSRLSADTQANSLAVDVIEFMKLKGIQSITARDLYLSNKSKYKDVPNAKLIFSQLQEQGLGKIAEQGNSIKFFRTVKAS